MHRQMKIFSRLIFEQYKLKNIITILSLTHSLLEILPKNAF